MTDPTKRLPQYRHYKPKNLAVVRIDGRDVYLGRYNSPESHAKYRQVLAQWLATGVTPAPARAQSDADEGLAVSEVILGYLRFADGYYVKNGKPTSEAGLLRLSMRPLLALYGRTPARTFGPLALKSVRQNFISSGLCRTEVNRRTAHIVRMFKWAVENELVPPSLHHGLRAVSGLRKGRSGVRESAPVKPVPDERVDAIEPHVSRQVWAMVQLQRLTGMRPGEVTIMRTVDLDTSDKVWVYTPSTHKTEHHWGKKRTIPLGPRAQMILKPWLRTQLTAFLFSPREAEAERLAEMRRQRKTPVQPSQRNRHEPGRKRRLAQLHDQYDVQTYGRAIAHGCVRAFPHPTLDAMGKQARTRKLRSELAAWRQANLSVIKAWNRQHAWHPNQLRHNAATTLRKEFGLDTARAVLGHNSTAITEIYAERDSNLATEAMERIG